MKKDTILLFICIIPFYGRIFKTSSNKLDIIGIDIEMIIILLPNSILLAIALSPESLHILTANSDKNAIPVIFIKRFIKLEFIEALVSIDLISVTIPCKLV